jgi:N-acetylglutamate synthase-like GNAT family acetyltransferase
MKRENIEFTLRPATVDDIDFIYDLRFKTMKPFFDGTLGWNEAKEREKAADELTNSEIVMIDKKSVGVIKVIPRADELHFHQMQILPEHQKGGIGAELLQRVIKRSEISNKPITLFVMKNTPAKRLYEQFGFSVIDDFEYNCRMCREPILNHEGRV